MVRSDIQRAAEEILPRLNREELIRVRVNELRIQPLDQPISDSEALCLCLECVDQAMGRLFWADRLPAVIDGRLILDDVIKEAASIKTNARRN